MKWTKALKYFGLLLLFGTLVMAYLANRDMTKIYGGLTDVVDASQFVVSSNSVVIRNVNVLAPDSSSFTTAQTVVVEDGVITSISDEGSVASAHSIIDGRGKFLIPGLTDSHVHLFKSPNDLLLYVANGVTQIREMIGEKDHLQWRQEIQQGRIGPQLFIASPRIGSFEPIEGAFMSWSQGFLNITNAEDAQREVKRLYSEGYDAVKIYSQINQQTYNAVTKTANSLDMRVVGHVPWSVEMEDIYSNQHELAHLEELMNAMNREFGGFKSTVSQEFLTYVESRSGEIAIELAANDVAVTTTLWLVESFIRQKYDLDAVLSEVELEYENPGISEWTPRVPQGGLGWLPAVNRYQVVGDETPQRAEARKLYWRTYAKACQIILTKLIEHDVKIMAGTDANLPPTVPGFSLHDEFISLNKAGMSPAQILASATSTPAAWLNNNAGVIAPGRTANFVLLDENPLINIANTRSINMVVLKGRVLGRATLDQMLVAVKDANNASRSQAISEFLD